VLAWTCLTRGSGPAGDPVSRSVSPTPASLCLLGAGGRTQQARGSLPAAARRGCCCRPLPGELGTGAVAERGSARAGSAACVPRRDVPFPGARGTAPTLATLTPRRAAAGSVPLRGWQEGAPVRRQCHRASGSRFRSRPCARHPPPALGSSFAWPLTSPWALRTARTAAACRQAPAPPPCPEPWLQRSHPNWASRLISCQVMNYAVMPGLQCSIDTISSSHFYTLLFAGALSRACRRTWKTFKAN